MKSFLTLGIALCLLTGCASVTYERVQIGPDGKPTARQTERAHAFLMKGAVDKIRSSTKDGNYTHSVRADGVQGQGDTEMLIGAGKAAGAMAAEYTRAMGAP